MANPEVDVMMGEWTVLIFLIRGFGYYIIISSWYSVVYYYFRLELMTPLLGLKQRREIQSECTHQEYEIRTEK